MAMTDGDRVSFRPGPLVAGFVLLGLGLTLLLNRAVDLPVRVGQLIAPSMLIGLGALVLLERGVLVCRIGRRSQRRGDPASGLWLIGIGVWMLISQLHLFGLSFSTSWPLFVILIGVIMVVRGVRPRGRTRIDTHD